MKLTLVIRIISTLCFAITATLAISISKANCQDKCGNVTIPYPFGIGSTCSANSSFTVTCRNSTTPPKPFLMIINLEILNISLHGTVVVNLPVSPINCSDGPRTESLPVSLEGSPFTISARYNSLVAMGCKNSVWLLTNQTTVGGCTPLCKANSTDRSCNGINCCQTAIPRRLQKLEFTYESIQPGNSSFCGYVFPTHKKWLSSDWLNPFDPSYGFAPLVLEWEFLNATNSSSSYCRNPNDFRPDRHVLSYEYSTVCRMYETSNDIKDFNEYYCLRCPDDYRCKPVLDNYEQEFILSFYYSESDYDLSSSGYCSCSNGFEGNPYVLDGCSDIDECRNATICPHGGTCINRNGGHNCEYPRNNYEDDGDDVFRANIKISSIVIGSVIGALVLMTATWKFGKAIWKLIEVIKGSRKYMFFKRNGGLLLDQQLAVVKNGIEKTRLFTSNELAKATDDYNENRIIGRGGEGIVYKGMLVDGTIVAVKKLERVNQGDVESFINEVVIVSQINHRNVVRLLGCCLESEVPRLVYEFIPNGTLFHHIHEPDENFPLLWVMRVRIAKEIAGALAYLHSAASVPIYHRDIKSTNILLDEKLGAKISDFGTSRSMSIDQTHVTTRVVGTFGYLDPEYFQSSQFTEKSDVYSFGVVLVEILTGEKAISAVRVEEGRGLAMHFLHAMEENQLFDIVDGRVLREGKREDIEAMAVIAKKCLHLNGKGRPTMKEVSRELEAIQVEKQESEFSKIQIEDDSDSTEDDDSDYSSSFVS